jgi:hypothetical protein
MAEAFTLNSTSAILLHPRTAEGIWQAFIVGVSASAAKRVCARRTLEQ